MPLDILRIKFDRLLPKQAEILVSMGCGVCPYKSECDSEKRVCRGECSNGFHVLCETHLIKSFEKKEGRLYNFLVAHAS